MSRNVVLKIIRVDCAENPDFVGRFLREVRALAKLNHPNVVAVYDAEHTTDTLFLVMEYLEGEDLRGLVARNGPLDVPTACAIVRQATAGVKHAHDRRIIHRDIKPNNLMLVRSEGLLQHQPPPGPSGSEADRHGDLADGLVLAPEGQHDLVLAPFSGFGGLGEAGGMAVLLLGAGHDLSREVREFLPGWRYVRLTTAKVRDLLGE